MDLTAFEGRLREITMHSRNLRPFICDGSPLDCNVFIVGTNPATEMERDWWDFWKPDYGFDKSSWLDEYIAERERKPLRPGRSRRSTISNTRRVIEWVIEGASPLRCLETNVFSTPSERVNDLGAEQRVVEPFDFLLKTIRPHTIVAHGNDATSLLEMRSMNFIREDHFARGWSKQRALDLGKSLRK